MIAHRISSGNMKKENIKSSFSIDVMAMSTLLPFCDAMFLEKQMAGFFRDNPLKNVLSKMPRIFSLAGKNDFWNIFNSIEASTVKDHLQLVTQVYGADWGNHISKCLKN